MVELTRADVNVLSRLSLSLLALSLSALSYLSFSARALSALGSRLSALGSLSALSQLSLSSLSLSRKLLLNAGRIERGSVELTWFAFLCNCETQFIQT